MSEADKSRVYPGFRWLILVSAVLGYITMQVMNLSFAPILPQIAQDLAINVGAATNLMTAFLFSGAVALFFAGAVCDRYGIMAVIVSGFVCATVPAALIPWVDMSYGGVLWARIFEGLSSGFFLSAMGPIIALWFPPREKGLAGGLMGASVAVGSAVGVVAGPAIFLATGSWRQMSGWLSLFGWLGLAFALVLLLVPKPQLPPQSQPAAQSEGERTVFIQAMVSWVTLVGLIVTFFAGWCLQCVFSLMPGFLSADKPLGAGFGPMAAGQLMLAVTGAGIISPIIGGILTDKLFKGNVKPVMTAGLFLCPIVIYAIQLSAVHTVVYFLVTVLALAGMAVQVVYTAIFIYIAKVYQSQIVGRMTGLWAGAGAIGGVLGLFLGGLAVKTSGNYGLAITLVALAGLAGLVSALILPKAKDLKVLIIDYPG
ncbi:putative Major facilitator superfamily MFS_1 [Syntrophobacter sp. SbD1]|nr:putative Major facilitator superfamily MFS_1 [Syntrophobacter sp. SbD1]